MSPGLQLPNCKFPKVVRPKEGYTSFDFFFFNVFPECLCCGGRSTGRNVFNGVLVLQWTLLTKRKGAEFRKLIHINRLDNRMVLVKLF